MIQTRSSRRLVLTLFALAALPFTAIAQSATGTLSGTVVDPNGAAIPGANITITETATGIQRTATTNDDGHFTIPLLKPSTYTLLVAHDGFATAEVRDLVLNVSDQRALRIPLKTGDINETVNVTGEAPLINESPTVGTVVDRQFVGNIPLNGRSFQSLISLAPGVVVTKTSVTENGQFSVNGQRANANYFTVDGVSANIGITAGSNNGQSVSGTIPGFSVSGSTSNLVSVDALQEFKILTSTFAAEFGRSPGGQIQIVTRSGTNRFSGMFFEYFRNDALDATDWFVNANPQLKKSPLRHNDFGAVVSGPLLLPRFGEGKSWYDGRNRTFFFFSYEGLRLRLPFFAVTDVPSRAARQAAPAAIKPLLDAFPLPTGADRVNGLADFAATYADPSTLNATSLRIDHAVNSRLNIFGRYNHAPSSSEQRGANLSSLNTVNFVQIKTQTFTVGGTFMVSPQVNNEVRFNYSRNQGTSLFQPDNLGGAVPPGDGTLFPAPFSSGNALIFFQIAQGGRNALLTVGSLSNNLQRQINLVNNLSILKGPHQLKFGVDYRRMSPVYVQREYGQTISFTGVLGATGLASPGTVLSGIAQVAVAAAQDSNTAFFTNFSAYGQDTWKVTPRLTLTYGLRWDVNPPPHAEKPLITATGLDNPATFALAPVGTPLYETKYGNFAPRVGLAYQLSRNPGWETIVRGGFGVFYDFGTGHIGNALNSFPYSRSKTTTLTPYPLSATVATPPPFSLDQTFTNRIFVADPNLELPRTYQWNITVDQSLGASQMVSAAYVGAKGRRLLRFEEYANPNPKFNFVDVMRNTASSDYQSFQFQFQRRLSKGLQALVSYTLGKSLDNVSSDSVLLTPNERIDPQRDRGPSDFDVRHLLSGAVTYNLPAPAWGAVGNAVLRGWAIDTIITARSASPVNVTYSRNIGFGTFSFRPDLVPGIPLDLDDPSAPGGRRFNNAVVVIPGNTRPQVGAFLPPVENRQGTLGRNALRGFPLHQVDFALRREFGLSERWKLQLRGEMFNLFNHPNFADPSGVLLSGNSANTAFGKSPSMFGRSLGSGGLLGGFSPLYQIGGPRSIQLVLKLSF